MGKHTLAEIILAVIAERPDAVAAAGAPVFYVRDGGERERLATFLSQILDAMAHDLEIGVTIIVKH